ncbi:MAG: SNF2-related protein [Nitrosopumilaceae archaeon]
MKNFGTLEYVLDRYSQTWSWKVTGQRAVTMVSKVIPQSWYGDGPHEAIVPDSQRNVKQIKWILERYPLEILSKSVWKRKLLDHKTPREKIPKIEKLVRANPGKQFQGKLLNFQKEGLDFLIKSYGNALLADEMGLGKCIVGTSLIETTSGQIEIQELWTKSSLIEESGDEAWGKLESSIVVQTFDGKEIVGKKVDRIFRQKINEQIVKVTLWDGSTIECTKKHRFLTPDGWKKAGQLTIDDKIAVPSKTLHSGINDLDPDVAELMGWQLAEGYEYFDNKKYVNGRFYNSDKSILSHVRKLAKKHSIMLPTARKEKTTFVISTTKLEPLFSKWGYEWGKKSAEKKIPKSVIESPPVAQKAFLQAMFDAEGHVGKTHCEFATASKNIAHGMRDILRHFGIWLRMRVAMKAATNGTQTKRSYYICTFGGNSIERFVTQFRLRTKRKQSALEELAKKSHNTNVEGIPSQKIVQKIADAGISLRSLNLFTPYKYTQGMSKELAYFVIHKLESTAQYVLANELQKLAIESIHWCSIKIIETRNYSGYVYDLSVPQTHNYVVNGMISHNTVETLAYLATEQQAFPALVVAPLVTLNNWQREIGKFLKRKSRNGRLVEGEAPTSFIIRHGKNQDLGSFDFYIINYELLHKRLPDLIKLNIKTLVCDEVQNLRSNTTQKYAAVKKLAALESIKYRIGLSGTPIYNRGSEIWPIVDILRPGLLGNYKEFCEYFCYVNEKGKAIVLENKRQSLHKELRKHVMLRRKKSDVLKELKEKVRYKEVIDADIEYYHKELNRIWQKLEEEQRDAKSMFDKSASYQRAIQGERQAAGVAKLPYVINFVENIMEIEESVVVFCHHKYIHQLLHEKLGKYFPSSIIGGQTDKARQDSIDAFQDGKTKLMIAGLRAGNVGINLSRARYVIFAELDWSPAIHRQAEDRLHRIGQKNTVFAYYLIGNGTLDDHVANVLVDKSYEIDAIMDAKIEEDDNKEKAKLILAQIHDKLSAKIVN